MDRASPNESEAASELLVRVIETLEARGLDRDDYQLYEAVDVEALERLLNSTSGHVEVRFTVEGIRLSLTPESVDVLLGDGNPNSTEQ